MNEYKIEPDKYGSWSIYKLTERGARAPFWGICGSRETKADAQAFISEHRRRKNND